jgi:cytochrome c oxidase subunit II
MQRRDVLKFLCLAILTCELVDLPAIHAATPRRIEITAARFAFDPAVITLKKGDPVVLVLKSLDVPHGLRFREIGLELKSVKGKPGEVLFTPQEVGEFIGHCSIFCGAKHGSMMLTLRVVA